MEIKAVITDFDGVILDSFREAIRRIHTLASIHEVEFGRGTRSRLIKAWGAPGTELLEEGLEINRSLAEEIYKEWERLDHIHPIPLIPGARGTLVWLRKNEIQKCLITSRHRESLCEILDRDDLLREFEIVTAKEDCPYHKPDPMVFSHSLNRLNELGIEKDQCIFIGDTPSDIVAGQTAGIRTLVVQTGPYLLKHALEHPIDLGDILQSIDDLPVWIEEHHEGELSILPF